MRPVSLSGGRLALFWLWGNVRRPGLSGLRGVIALRLLGGGRRNDDQMMASGTLDLFPAHALIALQVLITLRAGKLELTHDRTLAECPNWTTLCCREHQKVDSSRRDEPGGPHSAARSKSEFSRNHFHLTPHSARHSSSRQAGCAFLATWCPWATAHTSSGSP